MSMAMRARVLGILLCVANIAAAETDEAPAAEELARRHFERGSELYGQRDYAGAITEFEVARRFHPSAALEFDIGRCLEALGRTDEAIGVYERYLRGSAPGPNRIEVQARLDALRRWHVGRRTTPRYLGPGLLLGGALAIGLGAGVLYGSARSQYDDVVGTARCMPCSNETIDAIGRRETASVALVAISGAVLLGDLVWFGVVARRHGRAR
jgi:hypothetical protein